MQQNQHISVGLDIGGRQIKCLVTAQQDGQPTQALGLGLADSDGVRRGVVVDIERAAAAIRQAVSEAERISGYQISEVATTVNGNHLAVKHSRGLIAANNPNQQIDNHDLARVEEAATVVQVPQNTEILHVVPRSYRLDGQAEIKDPIGMNGVRLEVDALLVTVASPMLKNLERAIDHAGLSLVQTFASGIPAAHAVMDVEHREVGTCLVDVGHTTTTLAIYEEEELLYLAAIPIGASHIAHDLAIGLQTDLQTADYIAQHHVQLADDKPAKQLRIKNKHQETVSFDQSFINEIATERVREIFDLVQAELTASGKAGKLPGGLILVGGGANIPGVAALAQEIVQLPVEIGQLQDMEGAVDRLNTPQNANVIGLTMLAGNTQSGPGGFSGHKSLSRAGGVLRTFFDRLKP